MGFAGSKNFERMVGLRIRVAREKQGWSQKELSDRLGFKDRQILSAIENGLRKVSSSELLALMKVLGEGLEFFTDPFLLVGEGDFCWRARAEANVLDAVEERAKGWIAAYRTLGEQLGEPFSPLIYQLGITERSSFEAAWEAADRLVSSWDLGDHPADRIAEVVEGQLGVLMLYVDMPGGVSGAACHLPDFNTILVNRREPEGRRMFDFVHELFHILTWRTMPPERIDTGQPSGSKAKRVEQLADNFAGALLMPKDSLESAWRAAENDFEVHERINRLADGYRVTANALYVRLNILKLLSTAEAVSISRDRLTWNGRTPEDEDLSPLFSRKFLLRFSRALDKGLISERRAAKLLGLAPDEMWQIMSTYGLGRNQDPAGAPDASAR